VIREATPEDYPAAFALLRDAFPEFVNTLAGFLHRHASIPPEARFRALVAEEEGRLVGWGRSFFRFEEAGDSATVGVTVAPQWRRRGLGTALLEDALEHVAEAPRAFAFVADDGTAFAESRGFTHSQTLRVSQVDPRTVDLSELDRTDVELRTVADVGPEAAYEAATAAALDIPGEEPPDIPFEQWVQSYWENPDFDWVASYAAVVDGRVAALSCAAVDPPSARGANAFTGTVPDFRGRGLARLVKLAVLRRLVELGVTQVFTDNDERNAPMLAVNTRLGYRPHAAHHIYVRRSGNGFRESAGST
jgi:GNAT superfamily N-acetyltransferase